MYHLTTRPEQVVLSLDDLSLSKTNRVQLDDFLDEISFQETLRNYQLPVSHKLLFYGASGCGKTATAKALGKALEKKIFSIDLSEVVSSKLGETAKNIGSIFKKASRESCILFIDEFDGLGKLRNYDQKDSGEMKRLVTSLLQLIDNLSEDVILICATNYSEVIDTAILRRFQLRLHFEAPNRATLDTYYDQLLSRFPEQLKKFPRRYDISFAEAKDYGYRQVKKAVILQEKNRLNS
ncbi:ATPase [Tenacibaculum litopenaei]|jgi:SpoVK/Ycf46/Vps4 family AAA+-type ATPase|uniref:AAA family ATPase n=1 Tax=Tenacibaculum litopenaei TaxID=396016 RepID=UPI003892DF73